jgi:hypothetical protein
MLIPTEWIPVITIILGFLSLLFGGIGSLAVNIFVARSNARSTGSAVVDRQEDTISKLSKRVTEAEGRLELVEKQKNAPIAVVTTVYREGTELYAKATAEYLTESEA